MEYTEFEVLVVNDGSRDATLAVLIEAFDLIEVPEPYRMDLQTAEVRGTYYSRRHRNLRVVDKANGGKADALNTGINAVTIDAELDIEDDILPLARAFQSFEADDLVTYQLPVYPDRAGRADIVRLVDSEAEAVLRLFRPQADTGDLAGILVTASRQADQNHFVGGPGGGQLHRLGNRMRGLQCRQDAFGRSNDVKRG